MLFGFGMVLVGGCVVGTLYKMAVGRLPSLVAFAGLLAGSALYAEIHPWWTDLARRGHLASTVTLPQILGLPLLPLLAPLVVVAGFWLLRWARQGLLHQESYAEGHLQPWKAALLLALLSFASTLVIGMPMGVTTAYAKLAGMLENLIVPGHVANLAFFAAEPLNFIHPLWGLPLKGGPGPHLDGIALAQFPLIAGILCGAALSALRLGEWRFYARVPIKQCLWAFVGGTLMGFAARMAPACNVWHLMGGLPILAGQSLLFVAGLFPGAWLGSVVLRRYVIC
ncbi:YeeE/YedE thiosulfate transporter family protein [Trichloromonas sp.]|uniref:YeeE/YedE thiosulfate transporter family protein n=1 Tax=Trichloromonas sp. TaxID=3069249 RepID=UPI002A3BD47F|nr:YeeE/YedE thiosulfate transporter family protein [Trichloromonas sp.]